MLPLGGCPFHPPPFQNGDNGVGGLDGWEWMERGAEGMNTFPHPSIPLHSSTNRSQHAFVSALLLPFFPSPLERANTFSLCQHSPPLPVCAYVCVHAQALYKCGLGHVLLGASGRVCPYISSLTLPCGCWIF